jgi:hypothetical protein
MKKIIILLILISVAFPFCSFTQNLDSKLNTWSSQNPIEKLYLHTDRQNYYAGETIWFKGYFMSEFIPSLTSSTLFVELLNNQHLLILRKIFPVFSGTSPGQLELPDTLSSGLYYIRAYSAVMLNQPGFTFNKVVTIYGKENKEAGDSKMTGKRFLTFFPEGGNFVTGLLNRVAFKYTDKNGMPLPVEATIKNSKNEIITSFKSIHDGMGTFEIVPVKNESYYVTVKDFADKYLLPEQTENGIAFNVTDLPGRKSFKILIGGNNDIFKPAYMIGQIQNHVIFKQLLQSDKKEITGFIKTQDFYSGILHLTIFNKDDIPLAERITFIDNKEYVLDAELKLDTFNVDNRKRNHFTIVLKDTVIGNFSVSVTDADYESVDNRPENIYSCFLLNSDIRGYVNDPAFYFRSNTDSLKDLLELVMMTNGWSRFKWTDVAQNKRSQIVYKDLGYIKLAGKINIADTKKPLANKEMIMFLSSFDSSKIIKGTSRLFHTDSLGHFEIDSLLFYDKMKILFSEVRGKKNKFIRVTLDADSLHHAYPVPLTPLPSQDTAFVFLSRKMDFDYKEYIHGRDVLLENVIIKAKQKTSVEKLDEEYSTGLFSGNIYSRKLDLRDENYGGNIFQYLQERIMGLKVSGEPGNYSLNYRGGNLSYYLGGDESGDNKAEPPKDAGNVSLFLNEMQASAVALETVPVTDIALVKLFPNSLMAAGNGAALVVYTKKGADLITITDAPTDMITYNGYNIIKELYNPDYIKPAENSTADRRITLIWKPDVFISGVNQHLPVTFYNNDRTKRFKIIAEGITTDGRMLMLEKIIEHGK